jgi:multisubunit Na+/H+ antiporter MnhG subunit
MIEESKHKILVREVSPQQVKDSGMAFVLICLILVFLSGAKIWLVTATILLIINMTFPSFFYYLAIFWFTLANLLGFISSKILLTLIFFLVITPIGMYRKLRWKYLSSGQQEKFDSMGFSLWKKNQNSVFVSHAYKYSKKDLEKPY